MKRSTFVFVFALAIALGFASCGNDPKDDVFAGEYDLTIVTDSLGVDGEWLGKDMMAMAGREEPDRYGTLTITPTDKKGEYSFFGVVEVSGQQVVYYNSKAVVDGQGRLIVEPSTEISPADYKLNYVYGAIEEGNPLTFRVEMHVQIGNMDCGYVYSNIATKK